MLNRLISKSLYSAALGLVCVGVAASAAAVVVPTVTYQVTMKSPQGDMGTRKMTIKGNYFAWDANSPGLPMKFVKNKDGEFLISVSKKMIGKYPQGTNRQSPYTFLPGPNGDVKTFLTNQKAKITGTEKIKGKLYNIHSYTEKQTGWKCKLWSDAKTRQPYKLIMTGAKKTDTVTAVYTMFKLGLPVSDSIFELPKNYDVRSMPAQSTKPK